MKELSLSKGKHRFVIRYDVGGESMALDLLVAWVHQKDLPFDWFDAAMLSHQLGQHLSREIKELMPKTKP